MKYITITNSTESSIYKVGIRYGQNQSTYVLKSLFKHFIIKDVLKLRAYIFDNYHTYDRVSNDMRENISYLRQ